MDSDLEQKDAPDLVIWALTPNGIRLAEQIAIKIPGSRRYYVAKTAVELMLEEGYVTFERLGTALAANFKSCPRHVFIMATGIVVRLIAPHIKDKFSDPAVVVMDEGGNHVISLLSGHMGGANTLARDLARLVGATPVITTATDVNGLPAIDTIAREKTLTIENKTAIRSTNMAIVRGDDLYVYDPDAIILPELLGVAVKKVEAMDAELPFPVNAAGIYVAEKERRLPLTVLVLRPKILLVGIGCNRGTGIEEIRALLERTLAENRLSAKSIKGIASIDIKKDEKGLWALAKVFNVPIFFYGKDELNRVQGVENPSVYAQKHLGVVSVCEAAAIKAADNGQLIIPKRKTKNVTLAIARMFSTS